MGEQIMKWLAIPIEDLKEFDKDWKYRRTNIDGTEALIHEEMFNQWFPPVSLISETDEESIESVEIEYPYPALSTEDITNSPEWKQENDD